MTTDHRAPTKCKHFTKLFLVNPHYKPVGVGFMISFYMKKKETKVQKILKQQAQDHTSSR